MLYILHGPDTDRSRIKRKELRVYFAKKIGALAVHEIRGDDFAPELFDTILRSSMLFGNKHVVVCVRLLENKDASEFVSGNIQVLQNTEHLFILWEESIDAKLLVKLKKHAEKVQEFKVLTPRRQALTLNVFAICDALLTGDRARVWRVYQSLVAGGADPTEIFWRAWWQLKALMAVALLSGKEDEMASGQKPLVVEKAKRALVKYNDEQIKEMLWACVEMYHEERNGGPELQIEFEKLLLSLV